MRIVRLQGIRVVVFDLDDTLYPERSFAMSGFAAVGKWLAARMSCPIDPVARMSALFDTGDRRHVFDQLLAELGVKEIDTWLPQMIDCYRNHVPDIRLDDAAQRAIKRWRSSFKLCVISDGTFHVQQRKIEALGLADFLDTIILTDAWGPDFWKPHPRAFQTVEHTWNCPGPSCVYIADNPTKDFVAPRQLGWATIRLRRPRGIYADAHAPELGTPAHEVTSLDEIDINK